MTATHKSFKEIIYYSCAFISSFYYRSGAERGLNFSARARTIIYMLHGNFARAHALSKKLAEHIYFRNAYIANFIQHYINIIKSIYYGGGVGAMSTKTLNGRIHLIYNVQGALRTLEHITQQSLNAM